MNKELVKVFSKAIFYSIILYSIGSVELNSRFSVMNFSKDQEALQRAADALRNYMIIAAIWTVGTVFALYTLYGVTGSFIGIIANVVMITWIYFSHINTFAEAAKKYNLQIPTVFSDKDKKIMAVTGIILTGGICYIGV